MYRLVTRGARAANGERIRLETIRTPSGLRTSREAVVRFIAALSEPTPLLSSPRSKARNAQIHAAEKELNNAGFKLAGDFGQGDT
jgi:hypothetical protein